MIDSGIVNLAFRAIGWSKPFLFFDGPLNEKKLSALRAMPWPLTDAAHRLVAAETLYAVYGEGGDLEVIPYLLDARQPHLVMRDYSAVRGQDRRLFLSSDVKRILRRFAKAYLVWPTLTFAVVGSDVLAMWGFSYLVGIRFQFGVYLRAGMPLDSSIDKAYLASIVILTLTFAVAIGMSLRGLFRRLSVISLLRARLESMGFRLTPTTIFTVRTLKTQYREYRIAQARRMRAERLTAKRTNASKRSRRSQ